MAYRAKYHIEGSTALKPEVIETDHETRIIDFTKIKSEATHSAPARENRCTNAVRRPFCADDRRAILGAVTAFSSIFILFAFMGF